MTSNEWMAWKSLFNVKNVKTEPGWKFKQRIQLALGLTFMMVSLHAQQVKRVDSTHRPESFHDKILQFKMFPINGNDIVFLGDSITEGTQWSELLGMDNAVNRGISGDTTYGVLERLGEVTESAPAKVFILIGVNDLSRNIPDDGVIRNYRKIIYKIQEESPGTEIYIQTLLPVNGTFTRFKNHYDKTSNILYINEALRNLANQKNINLIDLYPRFLDDMGRLDIKYTNDGLHLTPKGYIHWANLLKAYLD